MATPAPRDGYSIVMEKAHSALQATHAGDAARGSPVDTTDMKSATATPFALRTQRLALHLVLIALLLVIALPASAGSSLGVKTMSPGNGQAVSGSITWEVTVSSGNVDHVDFAVDGVVKWTESVGPWQYNGVTGGLNTTQLSDGTHQLTAKAYSKNGKTTGSSTVSVNVANAATPAPPPPPPPPPPPNPTPPTSATLPSISGTPTVGQTLSASSGTWSGSTPMSYSYGWVRCASSGGSCSPISGAASATYTQTSADAGSTIRVTVSATNAAGSATATSAATALVSQAPAGPSAPATGLGSSLPARMPESSGSRSIYVSTGGSDSNAGTLAAPVATLGKAFALAQDGAIIYVRGGNYGVQMVVNRDFSPLNPVTLQSYPGERATFVGQTAFNNAVLFQGDSGIRIRNVIFAARTNINLKIHESQHIEVDHVISRDSGRGCTTDFPSCSGMGLLAGGGDPAYSPSYIDDLQIWNSVFTNNGGTGVAAQNHDHAIYLCGGSGASTGAEDGCRSFVIANNLIADSPTGYPIQIGQSARNGYIVNNTIDNTTTPSQFCAIVVWGTGTWADSNDLIANNLITNVAGSGSNAVCASLGKNLTGNVVRNNLAWGVNGTAYDPAYGSYMGFVAGSNLPNADPKYVDTVGIFSDLSTKDFHLQASSPALGKSDPSYTPPLDNDGNARPAAPALGAFN